MNCAEINPLFHAYVDNELDVVRSLDVERHIKSCAACAAAKSSVLALRSALQQNDLTYRAPALLRKRIRAIGREAGPDKQAQPGVVWWWRWLGVGATGFALALPLLRPAGISGDELMVNEAVSSHVRSLMVEHLTDVVSSDQHTVKPWFNGKLDFAPEVKDFAAQGFPLAGGRLDYLNDREVAALVYRHNKHLINVFVWPAKATADNITESVRGYSVVNRSANGLRYCLVSDLNEKELGELADMVVK